MDCKPVRGHYVLFSSFGLALFVLILGGFIFCDIDLVRNLQALFKFENVVAKNGITNLELEHLIHHVAEGPSLFFDLEAVEAPKQQHFGVESEARAPAPSESSEKQCNIFSGKWVFDPDYPLYQSFACPFMDSRFRCLENGRTDSNYTKLRWQPQECDIPRFDPISVLQLLSNKRVVFSGDSIGRNQWESFVCMLYQGVRDKRNVYEVRGQPITRRSGEFSVRFADYNATIEFYEAHFLVMEIEGPPYQLRLDKMSRMSKKWLGADVLVFNSAHWWNKVGIVQSYQEHKKMNLSMDSLFAYSKGMHYWAKWIDSHFDPAKVRVFFRAIAPSHFQKGQWNTGGVCHLDKEPILDESSLSPYPTKKMGSVERLILKMQTPVTFLNITMLTGLRKDGHISIWHPESKGNASETRLAIQDCSHWCLPGVPDTWNELLSYALLQDWGQPLK